MLTLNQIVRKLEELATGHHQINSFYFGDPSSAGASEFLRYPVFACDLQPGSLNGSVLFTKFLLVFADKVFDDESNKTDVLSDQQQIALDIFAQLREYLNINNSVLAPDNTMSDFSDTWDDNVSGWQIEGTINQFYARDTCQVPSSITTPTDDSGLVTIYDQDGNVVATLNPGQSYQVIVATGVDEGGSSQTYTIKIVDL